MYLLTPLKEDKQAFIVFVLESLRKLDQKSRYGSNYQNCFCAQGDRCIRD